MIEYNIHNFVKVEVDEQVGPAVLASIDFQIGFFRQDTLSRGNGFPEVKRRIRISPYKEFSVLIQEKNDVLLVFDYKQHHLALVRDRDGLVAYVTTGNFHIGVYLQILLVEQRLTQVHAAAVANEAGEVTLIPGEGGVGKTAVAGFLVQNKNLKILGDDIVILGADGQCYAVPRAFILKRYHKTVFPDINKDLGIAGLWRWNINLGSFIRENLPFKGIARLLLGRTKAYMVAEKTLAALNNTTAVPIERIFGKNKLAAQGRVKRVVFLERGHGGFSIETADKDILVDRVFSIIHIEWQNFMGAMFSFGVSGAVKMSDYFAEVRQIIEDNFDGAQLLVLKVPPSVTGIDLGRIFEKEILPG